MKINGIAPRFDFSNPLVMGILNISPDSFYDGGRFSETKTALKRAQEMIEEGASIIDLGAVSTRPGACDVTVEEEWGMIMKVLPPIRKNFPEIIISVDTFRATVAKNAVNEGADIINDISGGQMDAQMFETVAHLNIPYIMMHIQGTPKTMQINPEYENVTAEVAAFFKTNLEKLASLGKSENIILDPGFGFGKTIRHNYELLTNLETFKRFNCPLLVGVSRKSMIYRLLGISAHEALNGTSVINTVALLKGADILRVHDVKEAVEVVRIVKEVVSHKS